MESLVPQEYFLQPGYIYVAPTPTLVSEVLGSAVSVCLFDVRKKVGGVSQFLFPHTAKRSDATPRYGNVATVTLLRMMLSEGSKKKHLEAYLLGGAFNAEVSPEDVGRKNVTSARRILLREKVRIVSEDVGGTKGRKIVFNTGNGELVVLKVDRLRDSDWFPYP